MFVSYPFTIPAFFARARPLWTVSFRILDLLRKSTVRMAFRFLCLTHPVADRPGLFHLTFWDVSTGHGWRSGEAFKAWGESATEPNGIRGKQGVHKNLS